MTDADCVAFLQWALPQLDLRWSGFRKVRRQVCKRITRRLHALGLSELDAYRRRLAQDSNEWAVLDSFCRIPISRFWRDRAVFDHLASVVLPRLAAEAAARGQTPLRAWSAGCASGEEPYSLAIAFALGAAAQTGAQIEIVATDSDETLLARARHASYGPGSLKDLPDALRAAAFDKEGALYRIRPAFRANIAFRLEDIRKCMPGGPFDLLLCRNLVFTYFDAPLQREFLGKFAAHIRAGGIFVIGSHERLPADAGGFVLESGPPGIYTRAAV